ncbi:hypothetical protein [Rummeliibacillus suwonensis]|uniref:hypothetical protein n=1 Tax=Rummeliibacillus suwonensis TaxID=1306154 RepID=UPI00289E60F2|nr:hypothetical protein [Rummeliibacillus suwonensis]
MKKDKILVELKLPRNYEDLLKIWHEYGHVVHYQNMDKSLPFALMKLNNLHNMEGVALYYQFMCNDSNKQAYDFKIYEMLWWTFIEFFSIYEWLDFNMKKNINDQVC